MIFTKIIILLYYNYYIVIHYNETNIFIFYIKD